MIYWQNIRPFFIIIFFFAILYAFARLAGPLPFSVNSVTTNKTDVFTVSGEGKASAQPTLATVSVGIQANGSTVKAAQDQINVSINKVSENIKKLGVEAKDIQTTNYSVRPNIDYQNNNQKITGYTASTDLYIKIRQIDKANQVIDTATASGANQVGNVSFEAEDKTKAENEARSKAVIEAKKKAEDAAKIAGFSLGRIINYSENFGGNIRPVNLSKAADSIGGQGTPATNLEPGSSEITVVVNLSYEIR